ETLDPVVDAAAPPCTAASAAGQAAAAEPHHAAYLGYLNLLLGLERRLDPASRHAPLNDRVTAALARRLENSPHLVLQSYPGEVYPVDNAAVAASIALHDRVAGSDHAVLLRRWSENARAALRDPASGLLFQA